MLNTLIAVAGLSLTLALPTTRTSGALLPPATKLHTWAWIGSPTDTVGDFYDLGTAACGDTLRCRLDTPYGAFRVGVTCSADSGRTWSPWALWSDYGDAVVVEGDLDGDLLVSAKDLGLWAERQAHAIKLYHPASSGIKPTWTTR